MKNIAVIGSLNMDMTVRADRIPQPGETVLGRDLCYVPGGKGANQAVAAARLGAPVAMFGCVGQDSFGEALRSNLESQGVCASYLGKAQDRPTGLAMITVSPSDNAIVVAPGANSRATPEYLHIQWAELQLAHIVVLQNEIPLETVAFAIEELHRAGKFVIYNPAPAAPIPRHILELADCLTPNEHEVRELFPGDGPLPDLVRAYPQKLIVTLGSRGCLAALKNGELLSVPALDIRAVDATGAGDTFNGALAYALAADLEFSKALQFANAAAGLSTTRYGAQEGMPRKEQVLAALGQ